MWFISASLSVKCFFLFFLFFLFVLFVFFWEVGLSINAFFEAEFLFNVSFPTLPSTHTSPCRFLLCYMGTYSLWYYLEMVTLQFVTFNWKILKLINIFTLLLNNIRTLGHFNFSYHLPLTYVIFHEICWAEFLWIDHLFPILNLLLLTFHFSA